MRYRQAWVDRAVLLPAPPGGQRRQDLAERLLPVHRQGLGEDLEVPALDRGPEARLGRGARAVPAAPVMDAVTAGVARGQYRWCWNA